jgi:hypothetical protein
MYTYLSYGVAEGQFVFDPPDPQACCFRRTSTAPMGLPEIRPQQGDCSDRQSSRSGTISVASNELGAPCVENWNL